MIFFGIVAFDDPSSCINHFFHFLVPCQVIDQFKNSMSTIHPHRYKEPGPYVEIFERVISDLWKIYQHVLNGSEWCLVLPGLFEKRDKVPAKAMPVRPGAHGDGQGGSSLLPDAGQGGSSLLPDAGQSGSLFLADAGQKRPVENYGWASRPPSSDEDSSEISPKIQKVLPPPIGAKQSGGKALPIGGKQMPVRDAWADVVDSSVPAATLPGRTSTAPVPPPAKRWNAVEGSAEFGDIAMPKDHPVAKTNWGPKQPSNPPKWWGPRSPSYPPPKAASSVPAEPKNRWSRRLPFLVLPDQRATMEEQSEPVASRTRSRENVPPPPPPPPPPMNDAAARASSSTDPTPDEAASDPPTPPKLSQVPKVLLEDQIEYEKYKQYVKGIVEKWLTGKEERLRAKNNPKFKQNGLTNFLLMVAISSFLEVAKDAALDVYKKLYGHLDDWHCHHMYERIDGLTMNNFCKHGKQGMVWAFLESIGVKNFEPEEPADIDGWKTWLSASQLFKLMEWCFDTFWRDHVVLKEHKRVQLHEHVKLYYWWYLHIFAVNSELNHMPQPYPSGWTWEGYMKRHKAKLTELAVQTFRQKICNAESLAKLHTNLFARKVGAFQQVGVEFDQHGMPSKDYVLENVLDEEEKEEWERW